MGQYSCRCRTDLTFSTEPTISKEMWTSAYHWTKIKGLCRTMPKVKTNDSVSVPIKSSTYVEGFVESDWKTLDEFKTFYTSVWHVTLPKLNTQWMQATCTCPVFQKQFICKHVIGIAVRKHQVEIPEVARNVQIGAKRKRGRPAKGKKAHLRQ